MLEVEAIFLLLPIWFYSLLSLLVVIFVTKWFFVITTTRKLNLPPSPSKLPVIGNLHQLGLHMLPHRSLHFLAQRHGPLMLLHLGNVPTLVISSADAAREIMTTHDVIFSNRPNWLIAKKLLYDQKDVTQAPYGEYWRRMRSICVLHLLSAERVQSFRSIREEETALMVKKIEKLCSSSLPIDLSELLASLAYDVVCKVVFRRKYSEGDGGKKFKKLLAELGRLLGVFNVGDFIPWLGWINYLTGLNARVDSVYKQVDSFLDQVIDDCMASSRVNEMEDQMNFVDFLLDMQKNSRDGVAMDRENIKGLILDMITPATETTYSAIQWTMTEMLRHPEVMKKAQLEIRKITGSKPNVMEDDVQRMVYLKAIVKESYRLRPPIPLLGPRESAQDVKVLGYDISAKTRVIINGWAIGRDPASWEEPEVFRPERFLDSPIDVKGRDFQLIPFGGGRRNCPGTTYATALNEIALASLLHKFNWSVPGVVKAEDLDITEAFGIPVHKKVPLVVVATPTPHSF